MENAYLIHGGKPLRGTVELSGAKNVALKALIAALLFESEVVLHNIPRIGDIIELMHLLELLGAKATFEGTNTVRIDSSNLKSHEVDLLHGSKIRVSFMLFAPLLYRFNKALIPNPGGCRLGARSIDRVVEGLQALGIEVTYDSETGYYDATMNAKPHGTYHFEKASHTGTELLIMMSVFGEGQITIENAALEPEIDDLISLLNAGGAQIKREGNNIVVTGVEKLVQTKPHTILSDRIEAATYASLALATKGEVTIKSIPEHCVKSFNEMLIEAGAEVKQHEPGVWSYKYVQPLKAVSIETTPYPGFATDWQPTTAVLFTQAEGKTLIHERIFENRFSYVDELKKLGADIEYVTPQVEDPKKYYHFNYDAEKEYTQAIEVNGPQHLHGGVLAVADLRAGATLAIAALVADGESYVQGIQHLERGYENFVEKVKVLGGDIQKI
ncbi:MAG: UDP-N-acetylglucosamine 1-carboxyvinyltransferase [Weeksellaceae bacterium]